MTTVRDLLAALHADPADHAARLALADALEEHGRDEQAELTRLHARQLMRTGTPEELVRLCALLQSGVRPVVAEVVNSIGMRLALIPPGRFLMGSPEGEEGRSKAEHQHEVKLTQSFYLGIYPVTQGEYQAVMGKAPSWFRRGGEGAGELGTITDTTRFPVESVSWDEAEAFCRKLTEKERKEGEDRG